jgi:hypothetical protein
MKYADMGDKKVWIAVFSKDEGSKGPTQRTIKVVRNELSMLVKKRLAEVLKLHSP